jgi:hypothetical protein
MNNLQIPAKVDTPEVLFDIENNNYIIKGKCHPENVRGFIDPLLHWLDTFEQEVDFNKHEIHLQLLFTYLNSASLKYFLIFIQRLMKFHVDGLKVNITWYYEPDDEDMKETGNEFFELTNIDIPFEIIEYENQI